MGGKLSRRRSMSRSASPRRGQSRESLVGSGGDASSNPPRSPGGARVRSNSGKRRWEGARRPGLLRQLHGGYMELVRAIVRPPRAEYKLTDLGPSRFKLRGRGFERRDMQVINPRGLVLECSWWQPEAAERAMEELPCVVYMHGNSSCRLEALEQLPLALNAGCTFLAFDFSGCGHSEGEHITLGYHEKDDCRAVIEHLRATGTVSTLAVWGRSMGAATALLHGPRDPSVAAMVLDSPFSSLERLCREIVDQVQIRHKPRFLVTAGLRVMRSTVMKMTGLDILKLKPIDQADACFIPALFVAGLEDSFIPFTHTQDICSRYAGEKNLVLVEGGHNSKRPSYFMDSVSIFFYNRLCVPAGLTEERLGLQPSVSGQSSLLKALFGSRRSNSPARPERSDSGVEAAREEARRELGYSPTGRGAEGAASGDSEMQQALLLSLEAQAAHEIAACRRADASAGARGKMDSLVACATSEAQSTLPSRQTVARPFRQSLSMR